MTTPTPHGATGTCPGCGGLSEMFEELPADHVRAFAHHAHTCETCAQLAKFLGAALRDSEPRSDESKREMRDYVKRELKTWTPDHAFRPVKPPQAA